MSINTDMQLMELERKTSIRTSSGATREVWGKVAEIYVAINKIDDLISTQTARANESTHTGLTRCKNIKEGEYRLNKAGIVYQILSCNTASRLTKLYLKVVDTDV